MAYRFAMHENTGCTPNEQMFGQDDRLPVDLMFSSAPVPVTSSDSTAFAWQLREQVSKIHQLARDNLDIASRRQKRLYDQRSRANSEGGKSVAVQSSGQERQKPEDADSMGRSVGDYQTSYRRILSPEDPQGKAQVCTP